MERDVNPWYREPWPWIIIGLLSTVVIASFVTLGIAIRSYDGLVADDYYKRGKSINKTLAREERSAALGLSAALTVFPDHTVRVVLQSEATTFEPPHSLHLQAVHHRYPDRDRDTYLTHVRDGIYNGRFTSPEEGKWKVILETEEWRLPILDVQAPLTEIHWGEVGAQEAMREVMYEEAQEEASEEMQEEAQEEMQEETFPNSATQGTAI